MKIIYTSTSSKQKRKPTNDQRKLAEEWDRLVNKHSKPLEKGKRSGKTVETRLMTMDNPPGREKQKIASLVTPGADTPKKQVQYYSGTKMIGIGQMAKSNAVPIFSQDDAIAIAKMRR